MIKDASERQVESKGTPRRVRADSDVGSIAEVPAEVDAPVTEGTAPPGPASSNVPVLAPITLADLTSTIEACVQRSLDRQMSKAKEEQVEEAECGDGIDEG